MVIWRSQIVIGYLLLAIIALLVAGATYLYVSPILNKSKSDTEVSSLEPVIVDMVSILDEVVDKQDFASIELSSSINGFVKADVGSIIVQLNTYTDTRDSYFVIPENVFYCEGPDSVSVGHTLNLCNLNVTYVTNNGTHLIIEDMLFNKTLILPLQSYTDVIISFKVFDIDLYGQTAKFVWKSDVGISAFNDPKFSLEKIVDRNIVLYKVEGRYIYDPETRTCYKYYILPYESNMKSFPGTTVVSMTYDKRELMNITSTMCDGGVIETVRVNIR